MGIPDLTLTICGIRAGVTVQVSEDGSSWSTVYSEHLYPVASVVSVCDLAELLTPYARQSLLIHVNISVCEESDDESTLDSAEYSFTVVYCEADLPVSCDDFTSTHFLSLLQGRKTTGMGRLEYLHFLGSDTPSCVARYDDDTTATFAPVVVGGNGECKTIDVSPAKFATDGKVLVGYTVSVGARLQEFDLDLSGPDCAPVLVFTNSFGCDELLYCTGMLTKAPTFKRDAAYIDGLNRNYNIRETRQFKADTGVLNIWEAEWFGELLRSRNVRLVTFHNGEASVGKEVIITDSKSEQNNTPGELPRFTFNYEYAQRNHNIVEISRTGRIFDYTFDYTFN